MSSPTASGAPASTVDATADATVDPAPVGEPVAREPWPLASLLLLAAAVFVSVTTELLPTGLLSGMSRDLAVTEGRLGLIVTAYALMVAVLAAPIAMVTGRVGRRTLVTAALLGYAVCNLVTALSDSYLITVGGRLIGGLSHGLFWGMLGGYAGRLVSPDRVGRAVTITAAGGTVAILVGVPLGTAIGLATGWRAVFAGFAVVAAVLAVVGLRLLPAVPGVARERSVRMRDVIRLPGLGPVTVATGLIMLGHFSFITYIAPFLTRAGVGADDLAPALLAYGVAGLVGVLLAGALVDRFLRPAIVTSAAVLTATFAFLFVALSNGFGGAALAVAGTAVIGVVLGMLPVSLQAATLRAAPGAADPASALTASAFNIGIAGGALLGGLTLDHLGSTRLPLLAAGLTALGLAAVVLGRHDLGGRGGAQPARQPAQIV